MLRIYGDPYSGNCYKARLAAVQLGIAHDWVNIDVLKKESRTPEFLALNPAGQVPLLEIEPGVCLPESNAILHYLAEGSPLLPAGRLERAQVLRWMFWEQYTHEPAVASARFIVRYLGRPAEHAALLQRRIGEAHEALAVMEQHLAAERFLVAGRYTIADIALYAYTHVAGEGGIELSAYPAVLDWLQRVAEQPGHVPMGG